MVLLLRESVETVMGKQRFDMMAGDTRSPRSLKFSFNIQLKVASCYAAAIISRALTKHQPYTNAKTSVLYPST